MNGGKRMVAWRIVLPAVCAAIKSPAHGGLAPTLAPGPTMRALEQIEPRMPIASLSFVIAQPGPYYSGAGLCIGNTIAGCAIRGNFDISAGDTWGPVVTTVGALPTTGDGAHPWANVSR